MNNIECSVLIHSRTKYCDFRSRFLVEPDDFTEEKTKKYKEMILQTTKSIEELDGYKQCRKIVISDNSHIICGVTAYMNFFVNYNEKLKLVLQDMYGRSIYLFIAVVIKKNNFMNDVFFPSNQELARLLEIFLFPRWDENKKRTNDPKFEQPTRVPYSETIIGENCSMTDCGIQINCSVSQMKIFPANQADILLKKILSVAKTTETSACVNFSFKEDAKNSDFLNVTIAHNLSEAMIQRSLARPSTVIYDNPRVENTNSQNQKPNETLKQTVIALDQIKREFSDTFLDIKKIIGLSSKETKVPASKGKKTKYMILFDLDDRDEEAERTLAEIEKYLGKSSKIKNIEMFLLPVGKNDDAIGGVR